VLSVREVTAGAPRTLRADCARADPEAADKALQHLAAWSQITWTADGSAVSAHRLVTRALMQEYVTQAAALADHLPLATARFRPPYVRNHCYAVAHGGTS
jgi:hypothetical protein